MATRAAATDVHFSTSTSSTDAAGSCSSLPISSGWYQTGSANPWYQPEVCRASTSTMTNA
jgi:hypothetical protein